MEKDINKEILIQPIEIDDCTNCFKTDNAKVVLIVLDPGCTKHSKCPEKVGCKNLAKPLVFQPSWKKDGDCPMPEFSNQLVPLEPRGHKLHSLSLDTEGLGKTKDGATSLFNIKTNL